MLPFWCFYFIILSYLYLGARISGQRGELEASALQHVIYELTTGLDTAVPFLRKAREGRLEGSNALEVILLREAAHKEAIIQK